MGVPQSAGLTRPKRSRPLCAADGVGGRSGKRSNCPPREGPAKFAVHTCRRYSGITRRALKTYSAWDAWKASTCGNAIFCRYPGRWCQRCTMKLCASGAENGATSSKGGSVPLGRFYWNAALRARSQAQRPDGGGPVNLRTVYARRQSPGTNFKVGVMPSDCGNSVRRFEGKVSPVSLAIRAAPRPGPLDRFKCQR